MVVRPSSDRLRESLFSVLAPHLSGIWVWDACAGSGAVGLEALSRGARFALFSEPAQSALRALRANATRCGFVAAEFAIWRTCWQRALRRIHRQSWSFQFVYFDPPFAEGGYLEFLDALESCSVMAAGGLVGLEHPPTVELPQRRSRLERFRELGTRSSRVSLYTVALDRPVV
jgi:16S rRNA (guanine(966)-N(2))-methyltransferase RsmD